MWRFHTKEQKNNFRNKPPRRKRVKKGCRAVDCGDFGEILNCEFHKNTGNIPVCFAVILTTTKPREARRGPAMQYLATEDERVHKTRLAVTEGNDNKMSEQFSTFAERGLTSFLLLNFLKVVSAALMILNHAGQFYRNVFGESSSLSGCLEWRSRGMAQAL